MKRVYILVGVGTIVTLLIAFWVYSFLYGSPNNTGDSLFTNLGIFGESTPAELPPPVIEEIPMVDVATAQLRQLTTKPVLDAIYRMSGNTTLMRYIEAGTGHVFDIDLVTGAENRVSQISVPLASEATLSPSGDYAAIRSGSGNQNSVTLIDLSTSPNPTERTLPYQIEEMSFSYNNNFLFTEINGGQIDIKELVLGNGELKRIGSAPFVAATMSWSQSSTAPHVIAVKPDAGLIGYAYEVRAGGLQRLPIGGNGLSITHTNTGYLYSVIVNNEITSISLINRTSRVPLRLPLIPEKCVSARQSGAIFCGAQIDTTTNNLDNWRKGSYQYNDSLWVVTQDSASQLVNPLDSVGRQIDIDNIEISPNGRMVYFINKIDKSLWIYEL